MRTSFRFQFVRIRDPLVETQRVPKPFGYTQLLFRLSLLPRHRHVDRFLRRDQVI